MANPDNKLGIHLGDFITRDRVHIVAMTGSYFRGDAEAVLAPQDEGRFESVTYTYYEQLNGYQYKLVFKEMFREHVDENGARNVQGLNLNIFAGAPDRNGTMRALHVARQEADRHGLPYEDFVRHAFRFRLRMNPTWLPRPNVLIPTLDNAKKLEPDVFLSRDRIVDSYYDSLLNLTENHAIANPGRTGKGKIPSCVGIVGARNDTSPVCSACPFFVDCKDTCDKLAAFSIESGLVSWANQKIIKRRKIEADKNRRRRISKLKAFDPVADAKKMAERLQRKRAKSAERSKKYRASKTVQKLTSPGVETALTAAEMDELLADLDIADLDI